MAAQFYAMVMLIRANSPLEWALRSALLRAPTMGGSLRSIVGAALVANALSLAAAPTSQTPALVLDSVRIVDGTGRPAIENGRIVIDQDRIDRIGPAADINAPANAQTIDLIGR